MVLKFIGYEYGFSLLNCLVIGLKVFGYVFLLNELSFIHVIHVIVIILRIHFDNINFIIVFKTFSSETDVSIA